MQALAFIDLLGFSQMVNHDFDKSKRILGDFYNITYRNMRLLRDNDVEIKGNLFSDSLLAYSSDPAVLVNFVAQIYRDCLKRNNEYNFDLSKHFLLPRGGVSFGNIEIQDREELPSLTKNFIVSPALVHSAKMESQIKGSRLLIADDQNNENQVFNWNTEVKSILYQNNTFTFWKTYKYYDSLWFLDLNKDSVSQKEEVLSLIEIAIKLVFANRKNKNVLEQHLQTLRIGLLSYSKFISSQNDEIIKRIVDDFESDDFWLIWLTLIEMIRLSPDSWFSASDPYIIAFYKKISLKLGWAKVISEINKSENNFLLGLFEDFINEINFRTL